MSMTVSGNSLDTANNLNVAVNSQVLRDTLNSRHSNFYSLSLKGRSSFHLAVEDLSANVHLDLTQDANTNGVVDEGEVINHSVFGNTNTEAINQTLDAGLYHIRISGNENLETDYKLAFSATPIDYAGDILEAARNITVDSKTRSYSDWVGITDTKDHYKFSLKTTSDFKLGFSNLSGDADVQFLDAKGNTLTSSVNLGITNESITGTLNPGTYYVLVTPYQNNETFYNLSLSASPTSSRVLVPTPSSGGTSPTAVVANTPQPLDSKPKSIQGTLRADTFSYQADLKQTVFSGNGNVDFGSGARDLLDLRQFSSKDATINLVEKTGGVIYNPGYGGTRLFDAITLNNGKEILFEGIEAIKFADKTINLSVVPNDPLFGKQWNLHMMGVQNAWRYATGSKKVLVGIEDTGLAANGGNLHPDLRATDKLSNNYLDEMSHPTAHGTSVQGVIAAASNNGQGISGINWNSDVFSIDVMGGDTGDYDLVSATQTLINQANSKGQRLVVNLSLTGGSSPQFEQLIRNNQETALFVVASGNTDGNSLESPANLASKYDNVLAVGASWGEKDWYGNSRTPGQRISYKDINWWGSNKGDGLTVMGPSEYLTTNATKSSNAFEFGYDDRFNGTSAAVPNVTGVASIVWGTNSNLSANQIKSILSETAYGLGPSGYDTEYGYGFVNADAAVRRAMALAQSAA